MAANGSRIEKWDPYGVLGVSGKNPSVVVCAARNSGKTVTVRAILEPLLARTPRKGGYDAVFVVSRSAPTLDAYADWVPIEGPAGEPRPDPFINLRDRPRFLAALVRALSKSSRVSDRWGPRQRRTLVILDDFLEVGRTRYDAALSSLYTEGRHIGVTVVTLTQSLSELSTATRKNTTVFLCGQLTSGQEAKAVCDQYLSFCIEPDPADWPAIPGLKKKPTKQRDYLLALFRACSTHKRYGFLVVDFDRPALFSEAVAWFKAEAPGKRGGDPGAPPGPSLLQTGDLELDLPLVAP